MDRPKSIYNLYLLFYALELFPEINMKWSSVILVTGFVVQITLYTTSTLSLVNSFLIVFVYQNTEPFLNLTDFIHGIFIIVFMYILMLICFKKLDLFEVFCKT